LNETKVNVKGALIPLAVLPFISLELFRLFILRLLQSAGPNAHPLYQFLLQQTGKECTWNFCKYLIGPDGQVLKSASSSPPHVPFQPEVFVTVQPCSYYPPEVDPYRLRDKIVSVIPYVYGR
jgi:hypothetical protein